MDALIWIDWVIIGVIGISTLISLARGFVREAMSLTVWIGAFVIARTYLPEMQTLLAGTIETASARLVVAFAILFLATLVVGAVVSRALARLVVATGLSATDRVLGTFFGLARGLIVVVVALALLRMTPVTQDAWWQRSVAVTELLRIEAWSRDVLGEDIESLLPESDVAAGGISSGRALIEGSRRLRKMEESMPELPMDADTQSSSDAE